MTFISWLERFSQLVSLPAAWGIFLTGGVIYLITAWRVRFLALIVQYLFVGILFLRVFENRPEMAMMKIIVGWMIAGSLLLSARVRTDALRGKGGITRRWAANLPFRVVILATVTVVAQLLAQRLVLPYVTDELGLACIMLFLLALLFFGTEEKDASAVGVGVLNLLSALEIFYLAQDPGLLVSGVLMVVNLLVGLVTSYLTVTEVVQ